MPVAAAARRAAPFGLLAVVAPLFATPVAAPTPTKAGPPPEAEVRCADDSVLRVKLLDESLELVTKYGTLRVPVADVRRIDFATRTPPEVESRVAALIAELGHADYATRERASALLRDYRERAYHPSSARRRRPTPRPAGGPRRPSGSSNTSSPPACRSPASSTWSSPTTPG